MHACNNTNSRDGARGAGKRGLYGEFKTILGYMNSKNNYVFYKDKFNHFDSSSESEN